jgi:hypothetical protein
MKIEYSLTRDDIKAIWNHFRRYTTISIRNARVLYIAVPLTSLMLLLTGIYGGICWLQIQGKVLLLASLVSIPIHLAYDKWEFSVWYKNNFLLERGKVIYSITANEEELVVAKSDSVETRMTWNAITDYYQNEVITVMYLSPDNCFYIPTKAMTVEQRTELDELVKLHIVRKQK